SWYGPRALLIEPLLTTLAFAALWLAVEGVARGRALLLAAAGLAAGLAALTRGTMLFLPPLLAGYVLRFAPGDGRARARLALAPLGAALLAILPWAARNRAVLGEAVPVSTNGGISLWASYNPSSRGLGNAGEGYTRAL